MFVKWVLPHPLKFQYHFLIKGACFHQFISYISTTRKLNLFYVVRWQHPILPSSFHSAFPPTIIDNCYIHDQITIHEAHLIIISSTVIIQCTVSLQRKERLNVNSHLLWTIAVAKNSLIFTSECSKFKFPSNQVYPCSPCPRKSIIWQVCPTFRDPVLFQASTGHPVISKIFSLLLL